MNLLDFILQQERLQKGLFGFAMLAFGVFTAINLLVLSQAINAPRGEVLAPSLFFLALISLAIATLARQYALLQVVLLLEQSTCDIRLSIMERLRRIPLRDYEIIGRETLYEGLASNTHALSNSGVMITKLLILVMRLLAVLVALLLISPLALLICVAVLLILSAVPLSLGWVKQGTEQHGLLASVNQLLRGFKEIKLHRQRGDEFLAQEVDTVLQQEWQQRLGEGRRVAFTYVCAEAITLLLAGLLVFVLPNLWPAFSDAAVRAAVVILCLPTALLRDGPLVAQADAALWRLRQVEKALDTATADDITQRSTPDFQCLEFREVYFRYHDAGGEARFGVGPLSFTLKAGSITFIVGSNGSGKSTLMKLLTGLYTPFAGEILLDGQAVRMTEHRDLFAAIFTDFHLFDRLYGQENLDEAQANGLLRQLEINDRVYFQDGEFNTLELSSAQRKRLAMVVALLEDRPVYVLDEWAADQDPVLREQYYRTLLPTLQARGKTILAVTHDERFFPLADQVLRLEHGKLVSS